LERNLLKHLQLKRIIRLFDLFRFKELSFNSKIFYVLTFFTLISYAAFSVFFIYHQSKDLRAGMIHEGKTMAEMFAYSSRLGVFAENSSLLKGTMDGVMSHSEVVLIQVFSDDGRELVSRICNDYISLKDPAMVYADPEDAKDIINDLRETGKATVIEHDDIIAFWAPVLSNSNALREEIYQFTSAPDIIGFVRIVFTTRLYNKNLKKHVFNGVAIPVVFMLPCWLIIFLIIRKITTPLNELTDSVVALGKGGAVKMVNVRANDEIGKLASAFNNMVISLKTKDDEKRHIEEQLRQSQKMEAVGTLAGGIAHDFNNILSVIAGYASLLKKDNEFTEGSVKYIDNLISTTQKASDHIKSLLAFTRQQNINLRPVNINTAVNSFKDNILRLLSDRIELRLELSEKETTVMSDTAQLGQVLLNLSINARDAMPDGGTLTLSTEHTVVTKSFPVFSGYVNPGEYTLLSVTDTGSGIDKKNLERIFEPFFTTKTMTKGTGLGLSIVYSIVKHHFGLVDIKSEINKGTTFRIYLRSTVKEKLLQGTITEEQAMGGDETILVSDDDEAIRNLICWILEDAGYTVLTAENGHEAVESFIKHREQIRLLLLDIAIPGRNGIEIYNEINRRSHGIKALFMSGHPVNVIKSYSSATDKVPDTANQTNFISKPFLPNALLNKIREILDN